MPFYNQEETNHRILKQLCHVAQSHIEIGDASLYDYAPSDSSRNRAQGYIRGMLDAWDIFTHSSIDLLSGDVPAPLSSYRYKPHESAVQDDGEVLDV